MTYVTRPDRGAVLAAINDLRAELDLPPLDAIPRGMRGSFHCPIAKALSRPDNPACVGRSWATTDHSSQPLPTILRHFIGAFDDGEYPDLIESSAS